MDGGFCINFKKLLRRAICEHKVVKIKVSDASGMLCNPSCCWVYDQKV